MMVPMPERLNGVKARRYVSGTMSAPAFWELIRRLNVPRHVLGPRCIEFDRVVLDELKNQLEVRTPADERRVADGRFKFSWSEVAR